jgi:hypothetical protein
MIKKVLMKHDLKNFSSINEELAYWLRKSPEERIETVEYLRRQYHGSTARLQRTARVIHLADIEALGEV